MKSDINSECHIHWRSDSFLTLLIFSIYYLVTDKKHFGVICYNLFEKLKIPNDKIHLVPVNKMNICMFYGTLCLSFFICAVLWGFKYDKQILIQKLKRVVTHHWWGLTMKKSNKLFFIFSNPTTTEPYYYRTHWVHYTGQKP